MHLRNRTHGITFGSTLSYGYDALNRITGEIRGGTNASNHAYGYDLAGNRTSADGQPFTFDTANKYLGVPGGAAAYDLDGNLTSISGNGLPGATFAWDDDNELTTLTSGGSSTSYGYDGSGLRVWSQTGSGLRKFYIFDGDTLLGEVNAAGSLSAAYTQGANGLVSERIGSTNKSLWYHFGPQGETRQLTDATGAVADTYNYTAYGVPTATTGADANPYRYGGQAGYYTDGNASGAVLCTYRWYSPDMGRWLSRDPISYDGGHNLYGYCDGDPVGGWDPDGHQMACIGIGGVAGFAGAGVVANADLLVNFGSSNPIDWEFGWSIKGGVGPGHHFTVLPDGMVFPGMAGIGVETGFYEGGLEPGTVNYWTANGCGSLFGVGGGFEKTVDGPHGGAIAIEKLPKVKQRLGISTGFQGSVNYNRQKTGKFGSLRDLINQGRDLINQGEKAAGDMMNRLNSAIGHLYGVY